MKLQKTPVSASTLLACAFMLVVIFVLRAEGVEAASSSWSPTLLVNTEGFQRIDSGDGNVNIELQFGAGQVLRLLTSGQFQFSTSIRVLGNISGSTLRIDHEADIQGPLSVSGAIRTESSVSGAYLTFMGATPSYILGNVGIGKSTAPNTKLEVVGTVSGTTLNANSLLTGATIQGFGLYNCQGTANKLTYNATTKKFLCEADQTGGSSGGGNWSNTGSLRAAFDTRYVNVSGDTMTGALSVNGGFTLSELATPGAPTVSPQGGGISTVWGYKITATSALGETLASTEGSTSAGAAILTVATFNRITWSAVANAVSYKVYRTTAGGNPSTTGLIATVSALTYDDTGAAASGSTPTANTTGYAGIRTTTPKAPLDVVGTISGSTLRISGNADIHGPLAISGSIRGDGDFTINDDRTTSADAVLTFGNSTTNQTIKFNHALQKFDFSTSIRVLGNISGSTLRVDTNADVGGTLALSGATLYRTISDPTATATNRFTTYAADLAGRAVLKGRGAVNGAYAYQPALFQNFVMMLEAGGGTTINGIGTTVTNDTTISHPAVTETFGYMANFATAATSNDTAGTSSVNTTFIRGSAAGANGFFYRARIGVVDTTSIRVFSGLANQTIATMVGADSPAGHFVGFQFSTNRADTNWQFVTKDNTTQSTADTTLAFTANKVYDLTFFCSTQCTSITWRIDNVTDGTSATGTASSNLPGNTTALRIVEGVSTLTTVAKNLRMQFAYTEADR